MKQGSEEDPQGAQSSSSSPSHEFSFTISLHSSSSTTIHDKNNIKSHKPPFAIDLTPADDIFFHGHLLPLHLLSHFTVSPRSSTNSLDNFTLPIKELIEDHTPINSFTEIKRTPKKSKSFSLFRFKKWRKGYEDKEHDEDEKKKKKKKKKKAKFEILKRYMRLVRPLFLFRGRREKIQLGSFSGNLSLRSSNGNNRELRGRRGVFSAPASMRSSPGNSGLLVAKANVSCSTSDSTMEELQAAIQAAIAHCKNSISLDDKVK